MCSSLSIFGLTVQSPLAWLDTRDGIDVLLAVLVFATALTIEPTALRRLGRVWGTLLAAVTIGILVLPALSWLASRLVAAGSLRDGVMVAGLAPCEIASVATIAMAGGDPAISTGVLIGSTLATVALAGPVLSLEAGHVSVHPNGQNCSIASALEIVGERWTLLIVRYVFLGLHRFDQFQESLGIARNVVTNRLNWLVDEGILERVRYSDARERYECHLTQMGRTFSCRCPLFVSGVTNT